MSRPYIPTDQERGVIYRAQLGLADIDEACRTDHPFRGSHIDGTCFVCWKPQHFARHGVIHFSDGGFACDIKGNLGVTAPMSQRTRRHDQTTCPDCLVVLAAAAAIGLAA